MALARDTTFKRGDLKSAIALEDVASPDLLEDRTWEELGLRAAFLGYRWPLRLRESRIHRSRPSPVPLELYRFLCAFGVSSGVEDSDRQLFEEVVCHLVEPLTGSVGLRIGHPASEGMDSSFRERVKAYAQQAQMVPWEVKEEPLPSDNDLGMDVVTWFRFADRRGGNLHFLIQCATGSDWRTKLDDINLAVLADHLNWGVPPVRAFATPLVISLTEPRLMRVMRRGGLLIDRLRLCELATRVTLPSGLQTELRRRSRDLLAA